MIDQRIDFYPDRMLDVVLINPISESSKAPTIWTKT